MQRAPARKSCSTHTAWTTAAGCESRHVGLPQPVLKPATSIVSLTAKRSPSSGPLPVGEKSQVATKALLWATVIVGVFITASVHAERYAMSIQETTAFRSREINGGWNPSLLLFSALHAQLPAIAIRIMEPNAHVLRSWSFGTNFVTRIFDIDIEFF